MPAIFSATSRQLPGAAGIGSARPYAEFNLGDHVGDDPAAVERNRVALAAGLDIPRASLIFMNQVHGAEVAVIDAPVAGPPPVVDALVTATPGLALVVLVADCVPLLLADDTAGIVAAVHAGRRGVQLGVAANAVAAMRALGARDIRASIGAHIRACCYEVGADVQAEVIADVPRTRASTTAGRPSLDLAAGLVAQLQTAGVTRVETTGVCTSEAGHLFSYRRDGVTGRFAGVAMLAP